MMFLIKRVEKAFLDNNKNILNNFAHSILWNNAF